MNHNIRQTIREVLSSSPDGRSEEGMQALEIAFSVMKRLESRSERSGQFLYRNTFPMLAAEVKKPNPLWERVSKGFYRLAE